MEITGDNVKELIQDMQPIKKAHKIKGLGNDFEGRTIPFDCESILRECQVDPLTEIEEPPTALEIYSKGKAAPSFTLGNFSMIIGKAKSKKTFLLTCFASAATSAGWALENIKGCLPLDKRNVLYFDTEQSSYHLLKAIKRLCKLTNNPNPDNFKAFGLRKFKPDERIKLIEHALKNTANVGMVFIDGGRDLLALGINDEKQATDTTSDFMRWTVEFNLHLVIVLHQNKTDLNARGHFGTECLNKAETTISVTRSEENPDISIVECEYSRDISFEPFAFQINENGLPEACDLPEKANSTSKCYPDQISDAIHFEVLKDTYKTEKEPNYIQLIDSIVTNFGTLNTRFGNSKCRSFIAYYLDKGWIEKVQSGRNVVYKYKRALF